MSDGNKRLVWYKLAYYHISPFKQIRSSAWLEHYTDNVGVSSSNLDGSTKKIQLANLKM